MELLGYKMELKKLLCSTWLLNYAEARAKT